MHKTTKNKRTLVSLISWFLVSVEKGDENMN